MPGISQTLLGLLGGGGGGRGGLRPRPGIKPLGCSYAYEIVGTPAHALSVHEARSLEQKSRRSVCR